MSVFTLDMAHDLEDGSASAITSDSSTHNYLWKFVVLTSMNTKMQKEMNGVLSREQGHICSKESRILSAVA